MYSGRPCNKCLRRSVSCAGSVEAWQAWQIGERSDWSPWRPILYPLKAVIPLTAALMLLQGFSELVKCVRVIQERRR